MVATSYEIRLLATMCEYAASRSWRSLLRVVTTEVSMLTTMPPDAASADNADTAAVTAASSVVTSAFKPAAALAVAAASTAVWMAVVRVARALADSATAPEDETAMYRVAMCYPSSGKGARRPLS